MSRHAQIALRGALLRKSTGPWAARRYIERNGCPAYLFRLACQLLASHNFNQGVI